MYTLNDCAKACASYNDRAGRDICLGATFLSETYMTGETCFLKNGTENPAPGSDGSAGLKLVTF